MDIRNVKEPVPEITLGTELHEMYRLNEEQFKGYQNIENLPNYPFDINHPKNQVILKDFIGRVIEELIEGFESSSEMATLMNKYGWNINNLTEEEYQQVLNHMQNANEEQADALGFFFTLLMYSNILPDDILAWGENQLKTLHKISGLDKAMVLGVKMILVRYANAEIGASKTFVIFGEEQKEEYGDIDSYAPAFHSMSNLSHDEEQAMLFEIIYELNIARNLLKSRPWKQTQVMTKEIDFQDALVRSFYLYLGFLTMQGFNTKSLYGLFFKKQKLNLWRQKTNY